MKKLLTILFILTTIYSCNNGEKWNDDKLISVLKDMRITYTIVNNMPMEQRDSTLVALKTKVFEIHNITEDDYEYNMNLLKKDIGKGLDIEGKVVEAIREIKENSFKSELERIK